MSLRESALRVGEFVKTHEKTAKFAFETFKLLKDFVEKPGVVSGGQLFFGVLAAYAQNTSSYWASDRFGSEWKPLFNKAFYRALYESLNGCKAIPLATATGDKSATACLVELRPKLYLGIVALGTDVSGLYAKVSEYEEARELLLQRFRKTYAGNVVLIEHEQSWRNTYFEIKTDEDLDTYHTERTIAFAQEVSQYLKEGISRSVMVYGPPGTGKTTFVRTVLEFLGLRSIRLRPEEFSAMKQSLVYDAVEMFKPDAVIIDDFDRIRDQTALLEILEYLNRHVKVVFVTVNKRTGFDEATKRPGRFDLMKEVLTLEKSTVSKILGPGNDEYVDRVRDWPVAYVAEFAKRRRINRKPEDAEDWLKELESRQKPDAPKSEAPAAATLAALAATPKPE